MSEMAQESTKMQRCLTMSPAYRRVDIAQSIMHISFSRKMSSY